MCNKFHATDKLLISRHKLHITRPGKAEGLGEERLFFIRKREAGCTGRHMAWMKPKRFS